jgi:CheY-like chemotaxis protein
LLPTHRIPHDAPPLLLAAQSQPAPEGDDEGTSVVEKGLRILVVDDKDGYRKSMRFLLSKKYGAQVRDVGSGREAVAAVRAGGEFDLVFLDLKMYPMDGVETFAELRKVDAECPVVMMSAQAQSEVWKRAEGLSVRLVEKSKLKELLPSILSSVERRAP